jgi:hypothetical protein
MRILLETFFVTSEVRKLFQVSKVIASHCVSVFMCLFVSTEFIRGTDVSAKIHFITNVNGTVVSFSVSTVAQKTNIQFSLCTLLQINTSVKVLQNYFCTDTIEKMIMNKVAS